MGCDINVHVVRQFTLLCAACLTHFSMGINLAFPSVLNPAILASDSDIKVSSDQASWIASCIGLSGMVGYAVMPTIFEIFGRKINNIIANISIIFGCLILYVTKYVHFLVLARLLQGVAIPGSCVFILGLCECISPKRRGYFSVLNKVSFALGSLACHALGFVLNWREIAIFAAIPSCISLVLCLISAESPSFFANHGQFDKCVKTFQWYRGDSLDATKELNEFVTAQSDSFRSKGKRKNIEILRNIKQEIMTKTYRRSFFIVALSKLCLDACGRYFLPAYITQIIVEITNSRSLAMYISVLFDCILLSALGISCILVRKFNRRILLLSSGYCSAFLMFMVSFSLILGNKLNLLQYTKWLTPTIILLHTFITNVGLIPIAFAITGEVLALEHRGAGMFMSGIVFLGFYSIIMKLTPMMIENTGIEGAYSIYGSCLLVFLVLLQTILPETKDKTLQQIENELKGREINKEETDVLENLKSSNVTSFHVH